MNRDFRKIENGTNLKLQLKFVPEKKSDIFYSKII